jgi:hypothetical protein
MDFFGFYRDIVRQDGVEREIMWSSMWWGHHVMRRMGFPITDFVYAEYNDVRFLVPRKLEEWILADYGSNWDMAEQSWMWFTGPRNYVDETVFKPLPLPDGRLWRFYWRYNSS